MFTPVLERSSFGFGYVFAFKICDLLSSQLQSDIASPVTSCFFFDRLILLLHSIYFIYLEIFLS